MDLRNLLGKLTLIEGTMSSAEKNPTGPKFTGKWKGTDAGTPGKKLVGDSIEPQESILKDLNKGPKPKTKEQELAEEFQAFLEAEFKDTVDKRPGRKSDRPSRGHKEEPRYKTVKEVAADEFEFQKKEAHRKHEEETAEFGMYSPNEIGFGAIRAAQKAKRARLAAKKDDELRENTTDRVYTVDITRSRGFGDSTTRSTSGTIPELLNYFGYTLEVGKSYERERGRYKINMNPRTIQQLVDNLNKAASNAARNGAASTYYSVGQAQPVAEGAENKKTFTDENGQVYGEIGIDPEASPGTGPWYVVHFPSDYDVVGFDSEEEAAEELAAADEHWRSNQLNESHYKWVVTFKDGKQAVYHQGSPHYKDQTAADDIRYTLKSNPGATVVATKDGESFDWQSLLSEGWESGPEEYEEPYDDADDAYDRRRQEKLDIEAEKENAKRPQEKVYTLLGRGPNMEPNYKFDGGKEYASQEEAMAARERLMADPNTPNPQHIGIHSFTRYLDQTNEAVIGGGSIKNLEDYTAKRDYIYQQLADPKQADNYAYFRQALHDLNRMAKQAGIKIEESRAHKQLDTWFKNRERLEKFARGELTIPTPQERQAQLKQQEKPKKQVKEYGATNNVSPYGQPMQDPKQAAQVAQAAQTIKAATGATAPTTNITKAIDSASQGKPVGQADMKVLEPVMKDVATIAQDPKLAGQFKTLAQQVNQVQLKQQQAKK